MVLTPDQDRLKTYVLSTWANNHKKSLLGVLALLVINRQSCWSGSIQHQLETISCGEISIYQHSVHRLLRRLENLDLIEGHRAPSSGAGARRKNFAITPYGRHVLHDYCVSTLGYLRSHAFEQMLSLAVTRPIEQDIDQDRHESRTGISPAWPRNGC